MYLEFGVSFYGYLKVKDRSTEIYRGTLRFGREYTNFHREKQLKSGEEDDYSVGELEGRAIGKFKKLQLGLKQISRRALVLYHHRAVACTYLDKL